MNLGATVYEVSTNIGPEAGGGTLTLTNVARNGSGVDITNVLVGGVSATITAQGADWISITLPPNTSGQKDIIMQWDGSAITLPSAYTYNVAGTIELIIDDWTHWREVAGAPSPAYALAAGAVFMDKFYVIGGDQGGAARTNVYTFDGTTWQEVIGLPVANAKMAASVLNGKLYSIGGKES